METLRFYAPTFLDFSMTCPDKKGNKKPTGKLEGFILARTFSRRRSGKIKAERNIIPFKWNEDSEEAKVEALAKVIEGMEELPELDDNPRLEWIPAIVKERLP
jgi:hypothetical protein